VDPARRALYLYVVGQPEPVGRDQAATALGVPRHSAKFHLDRLVDEGLLDVEYRRLSGRTGPGAGRPAKLYRRADRAVAVSLPERQYLLAGDILARAFDDEPSAKGALPDPVARSAAEAGRRIGAMAKVARPTAAQSSSIDDMADALASYGYEPRVVDRTVLLANCPFHELSREHTQLVCGMNHALIDAVRSELGHEDVDVRLEPGDGRCCVTLRARPVPRKARGSR
jgi:predicted ArsR family transcriptional regulator